MRNKYSTLLHYESRTDLATGEIVESSKVLDVVKNEPEPFFLTYSREILALYGKSIFNATTKVLWKLLEIAEYNTGKVYVNAERRNDIMSICGISRASYDRAIKDLVDAEIIEREGSTYTIRHDMFWKGDREERRKLLNAKLKVSFSPIFPEDYSELEKKEEKEGEETPINNETMKE